ncbi:MAG: c-type cytochrome [Mariprofundales bacterium]
MKKTLIIAALAAFALAGFTTSSYAGVEGKCKACHSFGAKKKVGPGLAGIVGRKAGTAEGFRYKFTKYVEGDGWTWDEEHLAAWVCDSRKAVKKFTGNKKAKTKMPPQKVCGDKAKELIEFLKTI